MPSRAQRSGWMWENSPSESQHRPPHWAAGSQLGQSRTTQESYVQAGCPRRGEQQPLGRVWAVNCSWCHCICSTPEVSGWANWIKVVSFCLSHLKRQHPSADLYPVIWPFPCLFSLLLECTHVLESAGFFFLYQLISVGLNILGNSFIANDSHGRNIWKSAITFIEQVFLSWPLSVYGCDTQRKINCRESEGP